jgi:hypothetical protein
MKRKSFFSIAGAAAVLLALVVLALAGCGTLFNNKKTIVSAQSGAATEVTITENGAVVYQGTLPATISVNGDKTYVVQYKDQEGNDKTFQLQKKFSLWFLADILTGGGWIIDLITGDVMYYGRTAKLPIAYSEDHQIMFVDHIPDGLRDNLRIEGNIYR